jgi:hypothetical protein
MKNKTNTYGQVLREWIPLQRKKARKLGLEVDVLGNMRSNLNDAIDEHLEKTKAQRRKECPIYSGCLMYFPDAIKAVAELSFVANEQHNPGTKMHWDRSKSGDELDAMLRHSMDAGSFDDDGQRHSTKVAWRALANLQKEIEKDNEKIS